MTAPFAAVLIPVEGSPRWISLAHGNQLPDLRSACGGDVDIAVLAPGIQAAVYEYSVRSMPVNAFASVFASAFGRPYRLHGPAVVFGFDPADGGTRSLTPNEWDAIAAAAGIRREAGA
jgi:hypothetical protein